MRKSLEYFDKEQSLSTEYARFVTDLGYGDRVVFEEAREEFIEFARKLLP